MKKYIKRYITGTINDFNEVCLMGNSKSYRYAQEIAQRHNHKIFVVLTEEEYKRLKK